MKTDIQKIKKLLGLSGDEPLTPEEKRVIEQKGTEAPFSGKYYNHREAGTYICRKCGAPLYRSADKFDAGCGWPSFDDEIPRGRAPHPRCRRRAHGDHLRPLRRPPGPRLPERRIHTQKHAPLRELRLAGVPPRKEGGGLADAGRGDGDLCRRMLLGRGVACSRNGPECSTSNRATSAGTRTTRTYEEVRSHTTGHAEAVRVRFDPSRIGYEELARLFFEIHDPTQADGQGPDIGDQYRSEIFYTTPAQRDIALRLIDTLRSRGYDVVTRVTPATTFWPAEGYHQDYYDRKGTQPYCHSYTKRF